MGREDDPVNGPHAAAHLPGDWIVTRTGGRWFARQVARAIRWFTARKIKGRWRSSDVNHAAIFIGPTAQHPEGALVEARPRGAGYTSVNAYPDAIWSTGRLPARLALTEEQRERIVAAAVDLVGTPYGYLDDLAAAIAQPRIDRHITGREWWVRRMIDRRTLECAQLVDEAWRGGGVAMFPARPAALVVPEDLEELLEPAGGAHA